MVNERHYLVELIGGGNVVLSINPDEDVDIAVSEQITAYGDTQVDMVHELTPEDPEYPVDARTDEVPVPL